MRKLLLLATAVSALATSGAVAQDLCSQRYGSCMSGCVAMAPRSPHIRCVESCQGRANACYQSYLGAPRLPSTVVQTPRNANDAMGANKPAAKPAVKDAAKDVIRDEAPAPKPGMTPIRRRD